MLAVVNLAAVALGGRKTIPPAATKGRRLRQLSKEAVEQEHHRNVRNMANVVLLTMGVGMVIGAV